MYQKLKQSFDKKREDAGMKALNKLNLPEAMLIIPDGNGRWAKNLGLNVYDGHKAGAKVFAEILRQFLKIDIKVLGAWGFSEDNWKRNEEEIERIMKVIEDIVEKNTNFMLDNNIKFLCLGNTEKIKNEYPSLFKTLKSTMEKTSTNNGKILALFVDYGERYVLEEFAKKRTTDKESSTYQLLSKINKGLPLFDMVLRTSGEQRLSGFGPLASLAEFVSVKKNLPDLSVGDIANALIEYSSRERRLGGRKS